MKQITLTQLEALGACVRQRDKFRELFGDSVDVTPELVRHASAFNWDWAALHLLSASASADYRLARAAAWADYRRAGAEAWADYRRACAEAFLRIYSGAASVDGYINPARVTPTSRYHVTGVQPEAVS